MTQGSHRQGRFLAAGVAGLALAAALVLGVQAPVTSTAGEATASGSAATTDWRSGGRGSPEEYGGWYPGQGPGSGGQSYGGGGQSYGNGAGQGYGDGTGSTDTAGAQDLSDTARKAADAVTPSVVNIDTVVDYGTAQAAGTGIVLTSDGYVLTNHHVVQGATKLTGTVGNGKTYDATVVGYDTSSDLAVIKLNDASGLTPADLGDSSDVQVGDLVVGVGNAGGTGGDPTSLEGTVTALNQTITATDALGQDAETLTGLIGTDAPIQSGQSGGPLVDADGEVVGVDVAASTARDGSSTGGYAIPIDHAEQVAQQIIDGTASDTVHIGGSAFLGVQVADTSTSTGWAGMGGYDPFGGFTGEDASSTTGTGLELQGVVDDSAADKAGLEVGDTLLTFDGHAVSTLDDLGALVDDHAVGDRVSVTWADAQGAEHSATVTLGEGPVGD